MTETLDDILRKAIQLHGSDVFVRTNWRIVKKERWRMWGTMISPLPCVT